MMYHIEYLGRSIYGDDFEDALLDLNLDEELNSAGKFTFTIPVENEFAWNNIEVFKGEVVIYEGDDIIWFGRPLQIVRNWKNQKVVTCEGGLAYFNDSIQATHTYEKIPLYTHPDYQSGKKGFINRIIDIHNDQVRIGEEDTSRIINVGVIDVDDETNVYREVDYQTTAEVLQQMCLDTNGGYFILRKVKNETTGNLENYLDWRKEAPYGTTQAIVFGENLLDLNQDLNGADICTVLIPMGENDKTVSGLDKWKENNPYILPSGNMIYHTGEYMYHKQGYERFGRVVKVKNWSDIVAEDQSGKEQLFIKAAEWLEDQNTEITTIECSAADLHYIPDETKKSEGKLRIGQMVTVMSPIHGLNEKRLPIFKISMNLSSGAKTITIGTPPKRELTDIVKSKGGSTRSASGTTGGGGTSDGGGSGGGSGGDVNIPVKDVLLQEPGEDKYKTTVKNKKAKIDLSGYVTDVLVGERSVKDGEGHAILDPNDFGKVDDVRVDGESIVNNKIANLNSNNFGKVDDVQVNGSSIVDGNKIARLIGFVDGYQVTFKYDHHVYYWVYTPPVGGGSGTWSIQDSDINTDTKKAVYNSDNKSLRFDLNDWFQRKVTWGGGVYQYFANLGPDPAYHDPDDKVDGNYIIRTTFPFGAFYVNDTQLDLTSSTLNNTNNDERFSLNFINGGGIKVETSRHYDINGEGFDIKLSTIKEANKPHLETVFSDDTMFADGASSDTVSYYIQHDGVYLISIITSESNSSDILFEDSSGSPISPTMIITDSGTVLDTNVYAVTKLCQLSMGTIVKFTRWKSGSYLDGDTCLRTITELKNIDVSSASSLAYKSAKNILQVTSSQTTVRGGDSIDNTHSNGAIGIFSTIAYDADNAPPQALSFFAFEPSASVNRSGSISDPYAVATYKGKVVGSIGDNDRCRARTIVAYDNGPTDSQINSKITLSDLVDYSYYGGNSKGYFYCYGLIISAGKYSEGDEGYVTETEMEDAISDAVSTLESNFQDGVDAIYDACVAKGSTPASQSLSDVVQGIMDIPQGGGGGGDYIQYNPFPSGATTLTLYDDSNNYVDVQSSSIDNDGTADAVLLKWSNGMGFVIRLNTNPDGMYKVEFDYQTTDCIFKQDYRLGYLFENDPRTNYYTDYASWDDNIERNNDLQHHSVTLNTTGNYAYLNFNLTGIDTDGSGHLITISDLKVYKYVKKGAIDFYSDTGTFTIDEVEANSTYTITNLRFISEAGGA